KCARCRPSPWLPRLSDGRRCGARPGLQLLPYGYPQRVLVVVERAGWCVRDLALFVCPNQVAGPSDLVLADGDMSVHDHLARPERSRSEPARMGDEFESSRENVFHIERQHIVQLATAGRKKPQPGKPADETVRLALSLGLGRTKSSLKISGLPPKSP